MPVVKDTQIIKSNGIDEINFAVAKVKSSDLFSDTHFADDLTHVIYSAEHNKVLSFCSENYGLVENEQFFQPIIDMASRILGKVTIKTQSYDNRRFNVDIIADTQMYDVTKNDRICPMISMTNSYDGKVKQGISLSYYRQICSNGLRGFQKEFEFEKKHSKDGLNLPLNRLEKELKQVEYQVQQFKELTNRRITPDELEEIVEDIRTGSTGYPKRIIDEVPEIIGHEQDLLKSNLNAWLVYNGFNNALMHSDTKLLPEEKGKIDKRVLNLILSN